MSALQYLVEATHDLDWKVKRACLDVLNNPNFQSEVGSHEKHHAYPGGLVQHTAEVLKISLDTAMSTAINADPDILIPAAIFHDFLKVRDYSAGIKTPYRDLIRHVSGSYAAWVKAASSLAIDQRIEDAVGHCILSHHGRQEWGSPVLPQTVEAHILHYADMLSYQFGVGKDGPVNHV